MLRPSWFSHRKETHVMPATFAPHLYPAWTSNAWLTWTFVVCSKQLNKGVKLQKEQLQKRKCTALSFSELNSTLSINSAKLFFYQSGGCIRLLLAPHNNQVNYQGPKPSLSRCLNFNTFQCSWQMCVMWVLKENFSRLLQPGINTFE